MFHRQTDFHSVSALFVGNNTHQLETCPIILTLLPFSLVTGTHNIYFLDHGNGVHHENDENNRSTVLAAPLV